jgi:hypothetical protein
MSRYVHPRGLGGGEGDGNFENGGMENNIMDMSSSDNCRPSDHDNMRRAFEQFMLQSGNPTKHKGGDNQFNEIELKKDMQQKEQQKKQIELNNIKQEMKKGERKYWSIFHKFCNILQSQWMDIDDQTLQVVQSISGIRQRLPITMKLLNRYQDNITIIQPFNNNSEWKNHAYNQNLISPQLQSTKMFLQKEDVELALSHDLLQHEKMMKGLRNLFANLSEMHEALSRTLGEMMKHHLLQQEEQKYNYLHHLHQRNDFYLLETSIKSYFESTSLVDLITDLFHLLSLELYRKQTMVQLIIKSADDRLLLPIHEQKMDSQFDIDDDDDGNDLSSGPKKIVDLCVKKWPMSSDESFIDNSIIERAFALHEKSH